MTETAPLFGSLSYLFSAIESTWGTLAGTPAYVFSPVASFGLEEEMRIRTGQVYAGQTSEAYQNRQLGVTKGSIVMPLFGWRPSGLSTSLAQYWLGWAAGERGTILPSSRSLEWARQDIADERHLGCRVNGFTLQGGPDGISLSIDIIGQSIAQFTGAQSLPVNMYDLIEYLFDNSVTCTLNSTVVNISAFSWQVQRPLTPNWENAAMITGLPAASRWVETLTLTKKKVDASWQTTNLTAGPQEMPLVLAMQGPHQGTGPSMTTFDVATITMPRLSLTSVKESGSPGALEEQLTFKVLKPQSSSAASSVAWTSV